MKFGPVALENALGTILAHGTSHARGVLKKGHRLSAEDISALAQSGIAEIVVAVLDDDDVPEDVAAALIGEKLVGAGLATNVAATGRMNVHASSAGIVVVNEARLHAVNRLHEGLTIATLPNFSRVTGRQMVATIKIIPYALPKTIVAQAQVILAEGPLLCVHGFSPKRVGLILTRLPHAKPTLADKAESVMAGRLQAMNARLAEVALCDHDVDAISQAITVQAQRGCSPILVMGATAIVDREDVIPAALVAAGGQVLHLGMPVDPGNLLMLGEVGGKPVVGVPSCARSPKLNGFDWVLERLMADVPVTAEDIMAMGLGGLLAEIPTRPSPREGPLVRAEKGRIAAIVLAAGASSRMGDNKLLVDLDGRPLLASTLDVVRASLVDDIVVVTGRDAATVAAVASPSRNVENPDYRDGMASSIRAGLSHIGDASAAIFFLGDMPRVTPETIAALVSAFDPAEDRKIIVPTHKGRRGNPVLWGSDYFPRLMALSGDSGARQIMADLAAHVVEVAVDDPGILADADTPEDLAALRQIKVSVRKLT